MRSVVGFNVDQERLMNVLGEDVGQVDCIDLTLLYDIEGYMNRPSIRKVEDENGERYFQVRYDSIIEDLPILGLKKEAVRKRVSKLCDLGFLERLVTHDKGGNYTSFKMGENFFKVTYKGAEKKRWTGKNIPLINGVSGKNIPDRKQYPLDISNYNTLVSKELSTESTFISKEYLKGSKSSSEDGVFSSSSLDGNASSSQCSKGESSGVKRTSLTSQAVALYEKFYETVTKTQPQQDYVRTRGAILGIVNFIQKNLQTTSGKTYDVLDVFQALLEKAIAVPSIKVYNANYLNACRETLWTEFIKDEMSKAEKERTIGVVINGKYYDGHEWLSDGQTRVVGGIRKEFSLEGKVWMTV